MIRFFLIDTSGTVTTYDSDVMPWTWRDFLCWRSEDSVKYFPLHNVDRFEVAA